MAGIPTQLLSSLRAALAECDQFQNHRSLRNLFAETRLSPWRNSLPEADGLSARVDGVISYLYDKKHRDGSNALVSLLLVLADTMDEEDSRRDELKRLAGQLRQPVAASVNAPPPPVDAGRSSLPAGVTKPAPHTAEEKANEGKPQAASSPAKRDFFISYNRHDKDWAEWIAWQLENAGYTTFIQAWDFRPGGNFVSDMQEAAEKSERTIAVLSETYLASKFTLPEWNAAFAQDPTGKQGLLLPVKVRECDPKGLLSQIVYIDLTGVSAEQAAERLLAGVKRSRAKPSTTPGFPGAIEPPVPENP